MKRFLSVLLISTMSLPLTAQETHPAVVFGEVLLGPTNQEGLILGANMNYQTGHHLITARYHSHSHFDSDMISNRMDTEALNVRTRLNEWAILYGARFSGQRFSASLSAGISRSNVRIHSSYVPANLDFKDSFTGIPYELNIKFFKKYKSRYRIYFLVPAGKSSGFGRSVGMKLFGNFSGERYWGLGFTYGLGIHKIYKE